MEKLAGMFSLANLFRFLISGVTFVASGIYAIHHGKPDDGLSFVRENSVALGVAAVATGAVIYAVHRAFTNVLLELLRLGVGRVVYKNRLRHVFVCDKVLSLTLKRWRRGASVKSVDSHFLDWGDYVQLLYTSSLAIAVGSMSALAFDQVPFEQWEISRNLLVVGLVLLAAGIYNDCRKVLFEIRHYRYFP